MGRGEVEILQKNTLWKEITLYFSNFEKENEWRFFLKAYLCLRNSWNPNDLVLFTPCSWEELHGGGGEDLASVRNQVLQNCAAQISNTQLCWILKFAQEYTKLLAHMGKKNTVFDKAQVRQNEQIRRDNKWVKRAGRLRTTAKQICLPFKRRGSYMYEC